MDLNFIDVQQLVFGFIAEDETARDEVRAFPNCKHGVSDAKLHPNRCPECGTPFGAEGLYWPKEMMRMYDAVYERGAVVVHGDQLSRVFSFFP